MISKIIIAKLFSVVRTMHRWFRNYHFYYIFPFYLKNIHFISRILKGEDIKYDPSVHSKYFSNKEYSDLVKRVDLFLCPHNKDSFKIEEDVSLDLDIKNVQNLSVDIFEINTEEYYLSQKKPITSLIEVEGLETDLHEIFAFSENSQTLCRKHLSLSKIPKRRKRINKSRNFDTCKNF